MSDKQLPAWEPAVNGAGKRPWFVQRKGADLGSWPGGFNLWYYVNARGNLIRYATYEQAKQRADHMNWADRAKPEPKTVFVLWYTHKNGDDIYTYATEEGARHAMADICRLYWSELDPGYLPELPAGQTWYLPATADSLSDDEVLRLYFTYMAGREEFTVIESEVGP